MVISELYGKIIESTAGKKGYILSVNGRAGRAECIVCADADENEFTVDFRDVISAGAKVIYEDRLTAIKNSRPFKIGLAGFDEDGKYLGLVEDYVFDGTSLISAKIGKKNYPAERLVLGDAVIVKKVKRLKSGVEKNGEILFKKGALVTDEVLKKALKEGEYIQTNLKTI